MTRMQNIAYQIRRPETPYIILIIILIALFFASGRKPLDSGHHDLALSHPAKHTSVNAAPQPEESAVTTSENRQTIPPLVPHSNRFARALRPVSPATEPPIPGASFRVETEPLRKIHWKEMHASPQKETPLQKDSENIHPAAGTFEPLPM
jgi:hypothetical protein